MGNRGVLHDEDRTLVRQWQVRRWISCRLHWRGRKRIVMSPRRYTELFFLDEAASLATGHRPCAECRNADYKRFQSLWEACFGPRHASRRRVYRRPGWYRAPRVGRCIERVERRRLPAELRAPAFRYRRRSNATVDRGNHSRRFRSGRSPDGRTMNAAGTMLGPWSSFYVMIG